MGGCSGCYPSGSLRLVEEIKRNVANAEDIETYRALARIICVIKKIFSSAPFVLCAADRSNEGRKVPIVGAGMTSSGGSVKFL